MSAKKGGHTHVSNGHARSLENDRRGDSSNASIWQRHAKRRKSKVKRNIFSSVTLNKGSEWSQSVVYDEVFFPRLQTENEPMSRKIDNMWMVGFIHHAKTTNDALMKEDLNILLRLPESTVLPNAEKALTGRNEDGSRKKLSDNTSGKKALSIDRNNPRCNMTMDERRRLDELANRLIKKKQQRRTKSAFSSKVPYHKVNSQLNRVLRGKRIVYEQDQMQSHLMEQLLKINHIELKAVLTLQKFWRKMFSIIFMKELRIKNMSSKSIQAIARGYITRKWYGIWSARVIAGIILCQAYIRRSICMRRWRCFMKKRNDAVVLCQATIRSFLVRCDIQKAKKNDAAILIQCMWRCKHAVQMYQMMVRNKHASRIQSHIRGIQSRTFYRRIYLKKTTSATNIQRYWRGHCGRRLQIEIMENREMNRIENQVRLLASEYRYWNERVVEETQIMENEQYYDKLKTQKQNLSADIKNTQSEIQKKEKDFIQLSRQRQNLTPKLIEQGWEKTIEDNIEKCRSSITSKKLEYLFSTGKEFKKTINLVKMQDEKLGQAKQNRDQWLQWRDEKLEKLWNFQRSKADKKETIERKRGIAHEKRKWKVIFSTTSGKPDKMRQPGKPWDKSVFAAPARSGFCSGSVDIFAACNQSTLKKSESKTYLDPSDLIERIKLQSYLGEVQQYEDVWKPISSIMEKTNNNYNAIDVKKEAEQKLDLTPVTSSSVIQSYDSPKNDRSTRRLPWSLLDELQNEKDNFLLQKACSYLLKPK